MTNKSELFNAAWTLAKQGASKFGGSSKEYFAVALKIAYVSTKDVQYVGIKSWFIDKNFSPDELFICETTTFAILKETEKAVQLIWNSKYGKMFKWVPKSCMLTIEDVKEIQSKVLSSIEKYENLIAWAKENNVAGVRKRMKKANIIIKINAAGLTVPAELF